MLLSQTRFFQEVNQIFLNSKCLNMGLENGQLENEIRQSEKVNKTNMWEQSKKLKTLQRRAYINANSV